MCWHKAMYVVGPRHVDLSNPTTRSECMLQRLPFSMRSVTAKWN